MARKKKTANPLNEGKEFFAANPTVDWKVFIVAAMFAARNKHESVLPVKEYTKTMVEEFVLMELGYEN